MKVKRENMFPTTEDHGGYLVKKCLVCGVSGWEDKLKHKKNCPVNSDAKYLEILPESAKGKRGDKNAE